MKKLIIISITTLFAATSFAETVYKYNYHTGKRERTTKNSDLTYDGINQEWSYEDKSCDKKPVKKTEPKKNPLYKKPYTYKPLPTNFGKKPLYR